MSIADYCLYGLTVRTGLSLPAPRRARSSRAAIRLNEGNTELFERARLQVPRSARDWFYSRRLEDGSRYLRWTDLFEFLVVPDGRRIWYRPLRKATYESLTTYLLGQVLSFSMLAAGSEPLHGTVMVHDGAAVGFLGHPGAGKSTLGAALLARGLPMLTDDLVALAPLKQTFGVHPGLARLKLFPRVLRAVLGDPAGHRPRMNAATTKRVVPVAHRAFPRVAPLRALYVLGRPAGERIRIEPLSTAQAMLHAVRHTYNTVVGDPERRANQFDSARRLAAAVPMRQLRYPRRLSRLSDVCDAVLQDITRSD